MRRPFYFSATVIVVRWFAVALGRQLPVFAKP
jgi:hypothetical protein